MDGTDEMTEESEGQGSKGGKPGKAKAVMLCGAGLLVIMALAGGWFLGVLPRHHLGFAATGEDTAAAKPLLVDVPDIVANLDNGVHRPVFIKLVSKIEVSSVRDRALITADMPRILDAVQSYLRSTRAEEIHGGEGTYRLREALMNRIDIIASPARVLDVLFIEMLIQ